MIEMISIPSPQHQASSNFYASKSKFFPLTKNKIKTQKKQKLTKMTMQIKQTREKRQQKKKQGRQLLETPKYFNLYFYCTL